MLDAEVTQLRDEVSKHQKSLPTIRTTIDSLATEDNSSESVVKGAVKIEKSVRNNSWNTGTRKVFLRMMGIIDMKSMGVVIPLGDKSFFIEKGAGERVLRPDWSSGWRENNEWHEYALTFMNQKSPQLYPPMTKSDMTSKSDDTIIKRMQALYKACQKAYKQSADTEEVRAAKKLSNQIARHTARKIKKAESRLEVHGESGLTDPA
ncbi:hypothetical protein HWV62_21654 [Athelia sp. TMB]|nr:hypothetical protein HWV62_21654 [Athelia sp. TMB]